MPSVSYYNRTAPFWDFVAHLEEQGASHPLFAGRDGPTDAEPSHPNPWSPEAWAGSFPWGPFTHRGRHGRHGPHHPDDTDMPEAGPSDGEHAPPPPFSEKSGEEHDQDHDHVRHHDDEPHGRHHGRHGRHGPHSRGGGGCRRGRGGFGGGRDRRWGGGAFHPYNLGAFGPIAEMFQDQLFGGAGAREAGAAQGGDDFKPEADVFDTPEAFVVHVSLPGAKKEDVGVNWDADKSELSVAGVIYRPGDEEFLKTLALDERRVGAFERKVRLGSRANPAQVDVDGITAKMEDGVLRIEVPKLDTGYVEIKKVDVE